jgi:ribosomal-protein-alanine N-acetyltransferase
MQRQREDKPEPDGNGPLEILVERMRLWDVEEIVTIENQCFPTPWPAWAFIQDQRSNRSVCLVARVAGEIAGYAVAWLLKREMHIGNLAVSEGFRRRGVGSRLLTELLDIARPRRIELVTLEVRASNRAAINLYEKFGFGAIAMKPDYYRNEGEDALVMALRAT